MKNERRLTSRTSFVLAARDADRQGCKTDGGMGVRVLKIGQLTDGDMAPAYDSMH